MDLKKFNERVLLVPNGPDLKELEEITANFDRDRVLAKNGIVNNRSRIIAYLGDLDIPYYIPEAVLGPMKELRSEAITLST